MRNGYQSFPYGRIPANSENASTVLITGGTGLVGSHTVAALLRGGESVRLLVRDPQRVGPALRPHGFDPSHVRIVVGDVTDPDAVAFALRGCSAVLHAASVYSFDPRRRAEIRAVNVRGTEVVLDAARDAGAAAVHVSTFGALLPAGGETYLASKAAAETVARRHQDAGEPVTITCPPALLGPHDPGPGDQTLRIRDVLRGLMPIWPDGGFPIGDVRDLAELHAVLLTGVPRPGRFTGPGRWAGTRTLLDTLRAITGRRLPAVHLPAAALEPVGRLADVAQRVLPVRLPVQYGAIHTCRVARPIAAGDALGIPARPLRTTLTDTVRWLHRTGLVTTRQAGRALHDADRIVEERPFPNRR
jgi:dihydroflavonol-4-reductase